MLTLLQDQPGGPRPLGVPRPLAAGPCRPASEAALAARVLALTAPAAGWQVALVLAGQVIPIGTPLAEGAAWAALTQWRASVAWLLTVLRPAAPADRATTAAIWLIQPRRQAGGWQPALYQYAPAWCAPYPLGGAAPDPDGTATRAVVAGWRGHLAAALRAPA